MDGIIGWLTWGDCGDCKHFLGEEGSCAVDGFDSAQVEGDYVKCYSFELREQPELRVEADDV